jgi:nitroreductase
MIGMNTISLLKSRKSVRRFSNKDVNLEKLDRVVFAGINSKPLDENINLKFKLIVNGHEFAKELKGYGGYFGEVFDAPHYIAVITENKSGFLENLGYRVEQLMIKAHELGLGTCWIELFFGRDKIKKLLNLEGEDSEVVVVTPIGYEKITIMDKFIKNLKDSRSYRKSLKEIVYFNKWGCIREAETEIESKFLKILDHARLAPSWGNKQPWKFLINDNKVIVFAKKEVFRRKNELNYNRLDCGIIMLYFELVGEELAVRGNWSIEKKDTLCHQFDVSDKYEYIGSFIMK